MGDAGSGFIWASCHVGAEPVLRAALLEDGRWRPAFGRPGLVTLRGEGAPDALEALDRPHPLVRSWGRSLGRASSADALRELIGELRPDVVQVQPGMAGPPGRVPPEVLAAWSARARELDGALAVALGARSGSSRAGERVLDVVVRPDEPWIVGVHRHGPGRGPVPGGAWTLTPPADAPSRAWAKLEELIAWSGHKPARGQRALEVGAAPGGATVALLDRGVEVVAVDPLPVALPERLAGARFRQVRAPIEGVPRADLPEAVEWLVLDVSMAAPLAVRALERLVPMYRKTLKACFVTLKLNEWALARRLPGLVDQVRRLGFSRVEVASLPAFRQEVGLVAS